MTSKIWSRQYSLWLVPLVALARPRWRMSLLWQCSEVLVWIVFLLFLEGMAKPNHAIYYGWFAFIVIVRDAFLAAILGLVVWDMWHPEGPTSSVPTVWTTPAAASSTVCPTCSRCRPRLEPNADIDATRTSIDRSVGVRGRQLDLACAGGADADTLGDGERLQPVAQP